MRNLRQDGWRLVREGMTTLAEVLRVTKDERLSDNDLTGDGNSAPDEVREDQGVSE